MEEPAFTGELPYASHSLAPLPPDLKAGLTGVAVLACISLVASTLLFGHLTVKLVRWTINTRNGRSAHDEAQVPFSPGFNLDLGLAERHFNGGSQVGADDRPLPEPERPRRNPNQFVILFYNLLLADMHQSLSFFLNAVWVGRDALEVGTGTCWMQGWFVSNGDLSASLFITAIAVHTYCIVVRGWKPPHWVIFATCAGIWIFSYGMTSVGLIATNNGRDAGGFYVRATAWCWINKEYESLRLTTHYLFVFISLAATSVLYTLIFLSLRRDAHGRCAEHSTNLSQTAHRNGSKTSFDARTTELPPTSQPPAGPCRLRGLTPAFLVYPVVYVICTSPLAIGRLLSMSGQTELPFGYFCAAGALITSNGWLDVLIWGSTRRSVVFGAIDQEETGVETFSFMRTPANRRYGNMVWVEGAGKKGAASPSSSPAGSGFWGWIGGGRDSGEGKKRRRERTGSQESLRSVARTEGGQGLAIQMDMVTEVVVEVEDQAAETHSRNRSRDVSFSAHSASSMVMDDMPRAY